MNVEMALKEKLEDLQERFTQANQEMIKLQLI